MKAEQLIRELHKLPKGMDVRFVIERGNGTRTLIPIKGVEISRNIVTLNVNEDLIMREPISPLALTLNSTSKTKAMSKFIEVNAFGKTGGTKPIIINSDYIVTIQPNGEKCEIKMLGNDWIINVAHSALWVVGLINGTIR